jgi:hypothetical protein
MKKIIFLLFLFLLITTATNCNGVNKTVWPTSIPDSDILFQGKYNGPYIVGFLDASSSDYQIIEIPRNFVRLSWSNDGNIIYGLNQSDGQPSYENMGYPAFWDIKANNFVRCYGSLPNYDQIEEFISDDYLHSVVLSSGEEIVVFDMGSCKTIKQLVNHQDDLGHGDISGFSFFQAGNELLYGEVFNTNTPREYKLIKLNVITDEREIVAEGIYPTWSPDESKFAFIGLDGLYVMRADENQPIKIYNTSFFDPWKSGSPYFRVPQPKWSPDGNWIVFHQCINGYTCTVEDAAIYKIRVSDGQLIKLYTGGKYPVWHP